VKPHGIVPLIGLVLLWAGTPAGAHNQGSSSSRWTLNGSDVTVRFRISRRELAKIPSALGPSMRPESSPGAYLRSQLRMHVEGQRCRPEGPIRRLPSDPDYVRLTWRLTCPPGRRTIESRLLRNIAPNHLHFATVILPGGSPRQRILSSGQLRWTLPLQPDTGDSVGGTLRFVGGYLRVGLDHVLGGWDHLAFVFGLLLIAASGWGIVRDVTGFTLGHSLTLGLATFGTLRPSVAPVEALIALSVVFIGVENLWLSGRRGRTLPRLVVGALLVPGVLAVTGWSTLPAWPVLGTLVFFTCYFELLRRHPRPDKLRFWLAGLFGLIHGFGFAGRLSELTLPTGTRVAALLGFNAGVETGQLLFVGLLIGLHTLLRRVGFSVRRRWIVQAGSTLVVAAGTYWFVLRGFGG